MTPRLWHILAAAGLAVGLLAGVVFGIDAIRQHQGAKAEHNAAVASGEAVTHEAQARAQDSKVADLQTQLQAREADLGRLNAERDGLLKRLASVTKPHVDPAVPGAVGSDDPELDVLRATVAKDAEYIEALEADSKTKDALILTLTKRGDEWEAACHARERQALAQEAATKAWKDAVTTSRWKGRIEGFAAGIALGYLGGRR